MRPLEFTRAGFLATVIVFLTAGVCIRLGVWQLDRREQRQERNAAVEARLMEPPIALAAPPMDTTGLTHRRATVTGHYDTPRTLILGARSLAGSPGVHVYAPLRVADGAVLVNRGWVGSPDAATVDLSKVAEDTVVTVTGVMMPLPETGAGGPGEGGFRTTWFRLDADPVRAQYPYAVSPLYLQIEAADAEAARLARVGFGEGPVPLPPPALDGGPHLSYAIQWFSFATIAVVGWGALVMRGGRGREGVRPGTSA